MEGFVTIVINAALVLLTAIGLWITAIQAKQAKAARDEAAKSAIDAATSLNTIAQANWQTAEATQGIEVSQVRSASALETIAAGGQPWSLERVHPKTHEWMLRNVSNRVLHTSRITTVDPGEQDYLVADFDLLAPMVWSPNESELLRFNGGTIVAPTSLHFAIEYTVDGDSVVRRYKARID